MCGIGAHPGPVPAGVAVDVPLHVPAPLARHVGKAFSLHGAEPARPSLPRSASSCPSGAEMRALNRMVLQHAVAESRDPLLRGEERLGGELRLIGGGQQAVEIRPVERVREDGKAVPARLCRMNFRTRPDTGASRRTSGPCRPDAYRP